MSINAANPRQVVWTYTFGGSPPPFTLQLRYGPNVQISNVPQFTLDQVNYPQGYNDYQIVGFNYGIPIYGDDCVVYRADGVGDPQFYNGLITDGGGFQYIAVHATNEVRTTIQYTCGYVSGAGNLTVAVTQASGSIDTHQAQYYMTSSIADIHEDHQQYANDFGLLNPYPQTDPQPALRLTQYPYTLWFPSGIVTQICNTLFVLGKSTDNTLYVVSPPLLCANNFHTLY